LREIDYHVPSRSELNDLDEVFEAQQYFSQHYYNIVYANKEVMGQAYTSENYGQFVDYTLYLEDFVKQMTDVIREKDNTMYQRVIGVLQVLKRQAGKLKYSVDPNNIDIQNTNIAASFIEQRAADFREDPSYEEFRVKVKEALIPKRDRLKKKIKRTSKIDDDFEREAQEVEPAFVEQHSSEINTYLSEFKSHAQFSSTNELQEKIQSRFIKDLSLSDSEYSLLAHKRLGIFSEIERAKKEYHQSLTFVYRRLKKYTPMMGWVAKNYDNSVKRILQYEPIWKKLKRFIATRLLDSKPALYPKDKSGTIVEVYYKDHQERLERFTKEWDEKVQEDPKDLAVSAIESRVEDYLKESMTLVEKTAYQLHDLSYDVFSYPKRDYKGLVEIIDRLDKTRGRLHDSRQKYMSRITPNDVE
jgi:hypothetical protein